MKRVNVKNDKIDVTVNLDWDNALLEAYEELCLQKGVLLSIHFRNHKEEFTYTNIPVYTKPYAPAEKLAYLLSRCPMLQKYIDAYGLVLSV